MQHHFATWSTWLPDDLQSRYEEKLKFLNAVLSAAKESTPPALRATELGYFRVPEYSLETSMAALECATVCRHSHPDDFNALCAVLKVELKGNLPISAGQVRKLLEFLAESDAFDLKIAPVEEVIGQVERHVAGQSVPDEWLPLLENIHQKVVSSIQKKTKSTETLLARFKRLVDDSIAAKLKPDEGWADLLREDLALMNATDQRNWNLLLSHASTAAPEPPGPGEPVDEAAVRMSTKVGEAFYADADYHFFVRRPATAWIQTIHDLIAKIGPTPFETLRLKWLRAVPDSKPGTLSQFSVNRELLRGLIWSCVRTDNPELVRAIRIAAEYLYQKNSPVGRDAVQVLANQAAGNVLDELTYLTQRVKSKSQVGLIDLARALVAERMGLPPGALNDLPLPISGFTELGKRTEVLSGTRVELVVPDSGSVELRWFKPNGDRLKSIPAAVQREHESAIKDLKAAVKEVKSTLSTGKERLESSPMRQCWWRLKDWRERYWDHPVLGMMSRRLLWNFELAGEVTTGIFDGTSLVNSKSEPIEMTADAKVSVWHPLGAAVADVLQWREQLAARELTQPFKQAYREVYLLTDAERRTGTYSNRFASHILRQNQFRVLAKARGWTTGYLGGWSGGDNATAERELSEWKLRAELWTNAAGDENTEAGGSVYVATDQVRFCRAGSYDPLPLTDIPPLVFSEIMRDVDLFVGVTSIGNDPTWSDGGADRTRADYWHSFSFGELSESAITRRAALERIIPRLKIANRCTFSDRFLVVRGDIRTYRIHLGSGNIMMEPNNQYLCIVPDSKKDATSSLYLPFEGDGRLALILSKALLLADDTAITDPTIVSQIRLAR